MSYVDMVNAFLRASGSRVYFVEDASFAEKTVEQMLPAVDPRVLINSPGVVVEDVYRDGVLARFCSLSEVSEKDLKVLHDVYTRAKRRAAEVFMIELLKGVARFGR